MIALLASGILFCGSRGFANLANECSIHDGAKLEVQSKNIFNSLTDEFMTSPKIVPSELSAVYGKDDRVVADMNVYPYKTMGKLLTSIEVLDENNKVIARGVGTCTATLVGKCYLASARHCVTEAPLFSDPKNPCNNIKKRIRFGKTQFQDSTGKTHEMARVEKGLSNAREDDYSLIQLTTSPGEKLGYMGVLRKNGQQFRSYEKLSVAGYSTDLDGGKNLTVDHTATIPVKNKNPNVLFVKADSYRGASGGPVFGIADNGVHYLTGINSTAMTKNVNCDISQIYLKDDDRQFAEAVASEKFFTQMKKFMKDNPCPE